MESLLDLTRLSVNKDQLCSLAEYKAAQLLMDFKLGHRELIDLDITIIYKGKIYE